MQIGTSHFVDLTAAFRYYGKQGETFQDVTDRLNAGEIHVGPPTFKQGEKVTVIKGEGRYQIEG